MNKNRYRIIFSKAKNMFIAVAENIKSQSKATGQSTHSTPIIESVNTQDLKSFHELWQVKSIVASMSLFVTFSPAYAQMQVDPNAQAAQKASIGVGKNQQGQNVPVVNIQTPKNGVSHNVYNQFDVLQPGVVLNNSRNGAGSVIVGQVGANPYLQTGEARVILNEVNSASASRFEGNLEVAGQRADVIIANPSGINIQGGGFINANKAIFTTGKTQLNPDGSIQQFVVDQGKVNVSSTGVNPGLGGNNNNADYVDIYAKAIELNAKIYANQDLQVITGSNTINHDLSAITPNKDSITTPTVALDVKGLGGMYANNIYIIGTDKGLGVNNNGIIWAPQSLVISSSGKVINANFMLNNTPDQLTYPGAKLIDVSDIQNSQLQPSLINIHTEEGVDIINNGNIMTNGNLFFDSGQDINLNKYRIKKHGVGVGVVSLNAMGDINLNDSAIVENLGKGGNIYLNSLNTNINSGSYLYSFGELSIFNSNNLNMNNASLFSAFDSMNIFSRNISNISNSQMVSKYGINLVNKKDSYFSSIGLPLSITNLSNNSIYTGVDGFNLSSEADVVLNQIKINNSYGESPFNVNSQGNITWLNTNDLSKVTVGKLNLSSNAKLDIMGTQFIASDGINLQGKELAINTKLRSNKDINLKASEKDVNLNQGAELSAITDINVIALKGNLNSNNLKASSENGKIALFAYGNNNFQADSNILAITDSTKIDAKKDITIASIGTGNVNIYAATLNSVEGGIKVQSEAANKIKDSNLNAKGNIELFSIENLVLNGINVKSLQHTAINSKNNVYINSQVGDDNVAIYNEDKTSQFKSDGVVSITGGKNINAQNLKLTGGAILIEAGEYFNTPKSIEMNAIGSDLLRTDQKLNSINGDLTVQTNNALTFDPRIHKLSAAGDFDIVSKNGEITLLGHSGTNGNGSEEVIKLNAVNGGISLEGTQVQLQGSQLDAQKDIKVVSSNGNILISGLKNNFKNFRTNNHTESFVEQMLEIDNKIISVRNEQKYQTANIKRNELINKQKKIRDAVSEAIFNSQSIGEGESAKPVPIFDFDTAKYVEEPDGIFIVYYPKYGEEGGSASPTSREMIKYTNILVKDLNNYKKYSDELKAQDIIIVNNDTQVKNLNADKSLIQKIQTLFQGPTNGYEHLGAELKSLEGNIRLNSAKGISISGSDLIAVKGNLDIEAQASLEQSYITSSQINGQSKSLGASIIIDGTRDFYDKGGENDANYIMRTFVNPSLIKGENGVNIRTVGKTDQDNLILQSAGIVAANGDVKIESFKNIIFDAAVEQSYDRTTTTEKKSSWGGLKKKYITTRTEKENLDAASVEIQAKNISIESKEVGNPNNSIDIYSGKFDAEGNISIRSGGNINFYTANESFISNEDVTKKSSFAGIKYNDSKTSSTRSQVSQIPATLKADYIGIKSDFDTRLVGTEFEYLKGATIESGGTTFIQPAITNITETLKKEKNSVVWQSMQDKGAVSETAQLPSFNGAMLPVFKADGGLVVQIPVGEQDHNKVQIKDEILRLANQPGNQYLKDLVNRNDVDWNKIILAQKDWDYKSQGLTGAAAAIIVIIVAVITYGAGTAVATGAAGAGGAAGGTTVGMGASMLGAAGVTTTTVGGVTTITGISTLGAMANAAVTTLATQASVSLINNGGDVGKTLKDLGSKNSIRNLATSVVTAGVISQLGNADIMKDLGNMTKSSDFIVDIAGRTGMALINSGVSAAINTGINGGSLSENLEAALLNDLASSLQGSLSEQVGLEFDIENKTLVDEILHKVAHIASGCVAGAIQQQCEAGAIGAGVGEIVAGYFDKPADTASQQEKDAFRAKVLATTKVVSGTVAALTGYDVNTAATSAESAINNNYLTSQQVKNFHKEASDCKSNQACLKNVDNKYFGKTVYDNQGNVISGFYGANQEAFRNCNTTECRIQHGTALIAGQLAYNELNQDSINPNLWIKAKSYITNGGVYSYVGDKDQTYVNGVSQVLGFIEAKCGGALNEACQAKWIERNNQQKSAFLTLGGLLLSPAILKTVSYSASTLRGCLVSPTCSTNLKLTIDAAITDGSIYGAGATAVTLPSKQILQKESSKLGSIIANAFRLETPNASLGLCFSGKECFVAGTLVETDQGLKPIEKFIGGEFVWSRDDITLEYDYKPVIGLSRTENQPIYEVVINHPNGKNETLETTQEHPFWVKDIGWLKASLLKSGMVVYDRNNDPLTIVSQVLLAKVATVYNIEVESTHTYHVGELGVWVHNACCNVESLKFTLQKLHANGDNPLLKNGGKQINQISNNLMKDPDIESLFKIINLPQIQNAKGAADLMSAYYSSSLRPSVIQALNYADDIIKSNPKSIIEFEAKRINGNKGTTDIIVKNAQGVVTHAIELKGLDTITPTNVSRNISEAIGQLHQAQNAQTKIARIEVRNGYSSTLSSDVITQIQILKNKNPNIKIEIQFADGVVKVW